MPFDEEWGELVENARSRNSTSMQINHIDPGDGPAGSAGKLHVTSSTLRDRAGKLDVVKGDFASADDKAMKKTAKIPGSIKGFESDEAFVDFQKRWRSQTKHLDEMFRRTAKALREAADDFKGTEKQAASRFKGTETSSD